MNASSGKVLSAGGGNFENAIYNGTSQKVAFDGNVQSAAVGARTSIVRIVSTNDCHVLTGLNPTAVGDGTCRFLPKGVVEYMGIRPGDKIAVIKDATAGNLFITEGA